MLEAFRLGGWGMFPTLLFGVLLVAAAFRYARAPEPRHVPLQLWLGVGALGSGGLGFVTGMIKTFEAVGGMPPDQRWIWMVGLGESLHNLALALICVVIAAILATGGAYRHHRARA
jgi:hypothetical protein